MRIMVTFLVLFSFFRDRGKKKTVSKKPSEDLATENDLLCRFVVDGKGNNLGESVSLAGDIIIIKQAGKYLGVPLKHIEDQEKTLLVKGLVDFAQAEKLGEQWRQKSFSNITPSENADEETPDE
jgi:hypothetical protein